MTDPTRVPDLDRLRAAYVAVARSELDLLVALAPTFRAMSRKRSPKNPDGYLDKRQARRRRRRWARRPPTSLYREPWTR